MPAGWVAAAAAVYGAYESHQTAKQNRQAAESAQQQNIQVLREGQGKATQLLSPYIASSEAARDQLMVELGLAPGTPGTAYMQAPGYRAAMQGVEQSGANAGTLYSGRRIADSAEVQSQFYNNYMNLLQNMANPATATNLANIGIGTAGNIATGNLTTMQLSNQYRTQGTEATNAAVADVAKGIANYYNQYQNQQQANQSGTTSYV